MAESQTTARVRILVAVDKKGHWTATGAWYWTDREAKEHAFIHNLENGERYHWIEADVPLPIEAGPAIEGVVRGAYP